VKNKQCNSKLEKRLNDRDEDIRGAYLRDQTAIIHSMPFRRLKHKTQVFFDPDNDHVCTRIEHVLHVATVAATICKGLNAKGAELNEELAFAIGLAHDLGHAPFGHAGETALDGLLGNTDHFIHEVNGLRVVDKLAGSGEGLNLTFAVRDGIVCHNGEFFEQTISPRVDDINISLIRDRSNLPATFEACIVRLSDKIAYLGRDIEDALLANIITRDELPAGIRDGSENVNSHLINEFILDAIDNSADKDEIRLSDEKFALLEKMKQFNYEHIYNTKILEDYIKYCSRIIETLFKYLSELYASNGYDLDRYENGNIVLDIKFGEYLKKMRNL
jgi:dGTPase